MEKKTNASLIEFLEDRKTLAIDGEEGQLLELTFKGGETRVVYAPQKGELVSSQRWEMLGHAVKSFFARVKMGSKVFWVQGQWGLIPFWRACRRISRGIFRVPGRGDPCPAAATTCGWHSKRISSTVIVFCLFLQIFALKVELKWIMVDLGKEFDPMSQYMAQMCRKQC